MTEQEKQQRIERDKKLLIEILREATVKGESLKKIKDDDVDEMLVNSLRIDEFYKVPENDILLADKILKESYIIEEIVEGEVLKKMEDADINVIFIQVVNNMKCFLYIKDTFLSDEEKIVMYTALMESDTKEEAFKKMKDAGIIDVHIHRLKDIERYDSFKFSKLSETQIKKGVIGMCDYFLQYYDFN